MRADQLDVRPLITLADLQRWEDHGASWRAVEVGEEQVVVQLCTCHGEPVDLVRGVEPALIAFIRSRRRDARSAPRLA